SDRANVLCGELFSRTNVTDGEERTAEDATALLVGRRTISRRAHRLLGPPHGCDHRAKLVRLERERTIWTAITTSETEVLLDHLRSERYCSNGYRDIKSVIRQPGRHVEGIGEVGNGSQVHPFSGRRIGANALE